ncbi:MAG: T9SS type A sorting domain-containing protein [Bacteroidetes bacterium]|nr:T9SS type A sorting domain-containing protein [Bacteroidota bacterium]
MKKLCLFVAVLLMTAYGVDIAMAQGDSYSKYNAGQPALSTTPKNFNEIGNPKTSPAISTGYFFVDDSNPDEGWADWKPVETEFTPTSTQPYLWYRIYSGPRQVPVSERNGGTEGFRYFRNPADRAHYFNQNDKVTPVDSVNAAFAGPIPLGFAFYFNGIRYDSFYVSAKGVIALSNRRYFYDNNGNRVKPAGMSNCYDPMSADWFATGRDHVGDGLTDATLDDYGFSVIACGGNIDSRYLGIRRGQTVADASALSNANHPANMSSLLSGKPGAAYIAPFFGPYYLPQYDTIRKVTDDYGQVWYKRSLSSDKLIIYYKNLTMLPGTYNLPNSSYTFKIDGLGRPVEDQNQLAGSCQVILNRVDSSVTFLYGDFKGGVSYRNIYQTSPTPFIGSFMLVGVGGYARHTAYDSKTGYEADIWGSEYLQITEQQPGNQAPGGSQNVTATFLSSNYKIKFKQWRNALRLVDVQYLTRSSETTDGLDYSEEIATDQVQDEYDPFELFAGEERLGSMQPVAIIQNLTNEIQGSRGVNFVKQDFQFQARFRVRNVAFDRFIYNRVAKISDYCLRLPEATLDKNCNDDIYSSVRYVTVTQDASGNYVATDRDVADDQAGIPPYEFARVRFSVFEPNQYIDNQIGLMEAQAITEAINPITGEVIGDSWPFDDSSKVKFWVIRRIKEFRDDVADAGFHSLEGTLRPSILKWVHNTNEGPKVVGATADQTSAHPLPPIGAHRTANPPYSAMNSPFIEMNWNPDPEQKRPVGDKLTSFPVDLRNRNGAILTLGVQRSSSGISTDRGFSDNQLVGPESRAVYYGDGTAPVGVQKYSHGSAPNFDYLCVEFLKPSDDGVKGITNTGKNNNIKDSTSTGNNQIWRYHPTFDNGNISNVLLTTPALAIYGGGGYFLGWNYADKEIYRPVTWETTALYNKKEVAGVLRNPYDIGYDYEFYRYSVPIPDYYIDGAYDGGKNFRFRLRVIETDGPYGDQKNPMQFMNTSDEGGNDVFYVDNVAIIFSSVVPDIEMASVKILWPYTEVPASQANDLSVITRLNNVSTTDAKPFTVKVKIFKGSAPSGQPVYCRTIQQASLKAGSSVELTFPQFAARRFGEGSYYIQAISIYPGNDSYLRNDTTASTFVLKFSNDGEYAYDNEADNDVADEVGIMGKGLNLLGATFGGYTTDLSPMGTQTMTTALATNMYQQYYVSGRPWIDYIAGGSLSMAQFFPNYNGPVDGVLSGQIAMKITLSASDSLQGFKAMFAEANQAFDDISFAVYRDANDVPGTQVGKTLYARRLLSKTAAGVEATEPVLNKYVSYELPTKIALDKGTYWIAIAQRGETGIELAASAQRMAMRTMYVYAAQNGTLGSVGIQIMVDPNLRVQSTDKTYGTIYKNNNIFAFENVLGSNNWTQFMPTTGQVAYAHYDHFGHNDDMYRTLSRGTWLPLLRPYFGKKTIQEDETRYPCDDDISGGGQPVSPVEIVAFTGNVRNNAIELMWETASEVNNYGFLVERADSETGEWKEINFTKGAGNSTTARRYRFNDEDVVNGVTYQYRLLQMDYDGALSCHNNNVITVKYENNQDVVLEQNNPNPFNDVTYINFFMPTNNVVNLEVIDIYGKVVRTLVDNEVVNSGNASYSWNGRDNAGNKVSNGNYMLRLTVGNNTFTKKMSLIRNN